MSVCGCGCGCGCGREVMCWCEVCGCVGVYSGWLLEFYIPAPSRSI